jgi:hypothetical protein
VTRTPGRPRDTAQRSRIAAVLDLDPQATHADVARRASASPEMVRCVRRERGELAIPIGRSLLSGLHPRHIEALARLGAAVARGSDMQVRAVLAGPEMQQLITAARGASHA